MRSTGIVHWSGILGSLVVIGLAVVWAGACNRARGADAAGAPRAGEEHPTEAVYSADGEASLEIAGLVEHPLALDRAELESYPAVTARLNDVRRDGTYHGVFHYRGAPLSDLLEKASISKGEVVFKREMDLAVVATDSAGGQVVFSWGEIFYRNPGEILVAYGGKPRMPHKPCAKCHEPATYEPGMDQLTRRVPYPKIVPSRDFYSDRALEDVARIEVVDLGAHTGISLPKKDRPARLRAEKIEIHGLPGKDQPVVVDSLEGFPRVEGTAIQAGDGTGYHGIKRYSGARLRDVLLGAGLEPDPGMALLLSAPDGYRVLLSSGELFDVSSGREIALADLREGEPLDDGGRFQLMLPDDHSADRWLKSVARIDVLRCSRSPLTAE